MASLKMTGLDQDVLKVLVARYENCAMTCVIRNTLVMDRTWLPSLRTNHVLRACRRLEKSGYVAELASSYAVQKCWSVTSAGRAALAEGDTHEQ